MRILLLGGYGFTGRAMAPLLLRETQAEVVVGGRNREKADAMAIELNERFEGERVSAIRVDASDGESLARALAGVDLVFVALSSDEHVKIVAETALEHGIDYLDVLASSEKVAVLKSLSKRIESSGRCFITEAGFHPGLPSLMVRHAAGHFDTLERAVVSSSIKMEIPDGLSIPDSVYGLVTMFADADMRSYESGKWRKPFLWWLFPYRIFHFGPRFGRRLCVPLMFEELRSIPELYPSIQKAGFFIAGFNWVVDWFVSPLIMLALWIFRGKAIRPMGKLLFWGIKHFTSRPFGTVLQVEATGKKQGEARRLKTFLQHEDEYLFTTIPVMAFLKQYLDGSARKPGLWMMGHLADPARLLADVERMGIEVHTVEGEA